MFTARRIIEYVTDQPFRPFQIKVTCGEVFEIRHPETISVGVSSAQVSMWLAEDPKERERKISLTLIESIERLAATTPDQTQN